MMVSTRGRYALRVMLDLAEHGASGENIPMKDIAEREDLSLKYLEQIVPMLTKNGMIEGFHGKGGGYRLTRKPSEYTVDEILRYTEGSLAPVACMDGSTPCERAPKCKTLPMWEELDEVVNSYLSGITLADLISGDKWKK